VQNDYPPRIVDGKKVVRQVHTHLTSSLHTYFMQINVTTCEFYAMHSCLTVVRMQARNTALIINPHPQGALELRWMAPVFLIKLSTSLRTRIHLISIHVCIDVHIDLFPVCVCYCAFKCARRFPGSEASSFKSSAAADSPALSLLASVSSDVESADDMRLSASRAKLLVGARHWRDVGCRRCVSRHS
jgi:hypothetical protein